MGWGVGGRFKREETYVYLWLMHTVIWQKPTEHCKAITLQVKKGEKKSHCAWIPLKPITIPTLCSLQSLIYSGHFIWWNVTLFSLLKNRVILYNKLHLFFWYVVSFTWYTVFKVHPFCSRYFISSFLFWNSFLHFISVLHFFFVAE